MTTTEAGRAEILQALRTITLALAGARSFDQIRAVVTERVLPALGARGGGLALNPADAAGGQHDGATPSLPTPSHARENDTILHEDGPTGVRLTAALHADGKVLGWIEALFAPGTDTTAIEPLLMLAADLCAAAVQRVREHDDLTAGLAGHEASEARLRAVVEMLPVGVWLTDTEGAILVDNPAGQQIWGRRYQGKDHFGSARAWWVESGEPVASTDWSLARALRTGEPVMNEIIDIEAPDGTRRSILGSAVPVRNSAGEMEGVLILNEEITALREAQAAREASEERLRLAAQVTGFGAYDDRGDGDVFWSPELKAIFGLPPDAAITSGVEAALLRIHPDDRDRWLYAIAAARDPNGTGDLEIEHRILRPDGATVWVVQKGRILFQGEGAARRGVRAIGLAFDITARKQAEARQQFLTDLGEMIRQIDDPDELLGAVTRAIGRFLGVARCLFDEVDLEADREVVREDYRAGVPSVVGEHRLSDYSPIAMQDMLAGRTVVNHDAKTDPRTAALYETTYGPTDERAYVAVPLLREGRWVATLWVSTATPRIWTADEIALLEVVAERTWLAVEKARAEQSLYESEERFAKAFASSPHLISISRLADGRYLDVNDAVLRATGYTREEMLGRTSTELGIFPYPEGRERLVQAMRAGGGTVRNLELELRGKHGGIQTVLLSAETITLGGEPCILTTSNDITERKRVDDALRDSGAKLAVELADATLLQHMSSQLIQENDIDALYEQIVDAAIALMRSDMGSMQMLYPERNELQLLAWRGFDPASAAFWEWVRVDSSTTCGAALHTREQVIVPDVETCDFMAGTEDLDFYRLSGMRAMQSTPLVSRGGHLVGMISTHWRAPHQPSERDLRLLDVLARQAADLIERRQTEEALRASEERVRLALSAAGMGSFIWYPEEDRGEPDARMLALFGLPPDSALTLAVAMATLIHPDDRDRYFTAVGRSIDPAGSGELQEEIRVIHPNGTERWVVVSARTTFAGEPRRAIRMAGVAADITDRKHAEEAVRESAARQAFLLRLSDVLRSLADPVDIQETVTRTAMHYLGADRCYYCEIENGNAIVLRDASREGLPSVAGVYPLSSFAIYQAVLDAGGPFIVQDVHTTDMVDEDLRRLCIQLQVISYINVPVIKNGRPVGILCLTQSTPRDWTDLEVGLAVETAERTWAAVERARAEAALRESEARSRAILETANEGVWLIDPSARTVFANRRMADLLGTTLDDLVQRAVPEFCFPEDIPLAQERIGRNLAGQTEEFDFRFRCADGEAVLVLAATSPVYDAGGRVTGALGMFSDITERMRSEAVLQRQVAIIELAYDPVIVWELHGGIVYWNRAAEQLYGYTAEEALGRVTHELLHTVRSIPIAEFLPLLEREREWVGELTHITRDGRQIVAETRHVLVDEPDGRRLVLETIRDITARRQIEDERERLLAAEQQARADAEANAERVQRLQAITAALAGALTPEQVARVVVEQGTAAVGADGGAVRLLSPDGAYLETAASRNLHPYSAKRWQRIPVETVSPATDAARTGEASFFESRDAMVAVYPELADELRAAGYEAGAQIPLVVEGRVLGVLGLHFAAPRRISEADRALIGTLAHQCAQALERARLYQVEQEARTRAEVAMQMREHVLAAVTHDLRNPLAAVKGSAQMMKRQLARLPDGGHGHLLASVDRIEAAAAKMNLMMEELLDTARLQAGEPVELRLEPTDLVRLARAAAENARQTATRHQVQVRHAGELLLGEWDSIRLERVIDNLLSNAVKYSPDGGSVTLTLLHEQRDGQSWAVLTIADEGMGIPAADLPHIFEHFRRGGNVSGRISGTGIGLAGAKRIVEQHGGAIAIDSREGDGTTVTLRLPMTGGSRE